MNASAKLRFVVLITLLLFQAGCTALPVKWLRPSEPSVSPWPAALPEEQDIDPQGIAALLDTIAQRKLPVQSFLLVRGDRLIAEHYFDGHHREDPHLLYSATKSVTSALVGIAIEEGLIRGTDQKVLDFFPEIKEQNADPLLAGLTIEHLLTMSAGIDTFVAPNPSVNKNWVEEYLTQTFANPPGSSFFYNSGASHVLAAILQKATGKPVQEYAREKLFDPLGIREFSWLADTNKINFGNSWLELRPIDMAKIGVLYLHQGAWDGQQILPAEWVERSTRKSIDTAGKMNIAEADGYGYGWWMNSFGGYSAHGFGGQYIFVVPELDLVVVFTGEFDEEGFPTGYELMRDFVIPAVRAQQ